MHVSWRAPLVTVICLVTIAFPALAAQNQKQTSLPSAGSQSATGLPEPASVEVPAVNYFAQGQTKVVLPPTPLMPGAIGKGVVKVLTTGDTYVDLKFTGFKDATTFGNEFLTYILWGSIPKGRTLKIGELSLKGDQGRVTARTALRTFAMIVTAEPYAAVTQPSSIVIIKGASTANGTTQTPARIELLADAYAAPGYRYEPLDTRSGYAPELIQAMNARRIAKALQAENYAPQEFAAAEDSYQYMIRTLIEKKKASKYLLMVANNVAEIYEKARAISVREQQGSK